MDFKKIQEETHCIFSKGAKIENYEQWDGSLPTKLNIERFTPILLEFVKSSESKKLDGLSLEVKKETQNVQELALLTNELLFTINRYDPKQFHLDRNEIKKEGWVFKFNGMNLHILTFASCYNNNHPRNNYGLKNTYFLFQPHHSFIRKRDSTGFIPEFQKEAIRNKFTLAKMPYDVELSKSSLTAYKFVKPINIGDKMIKWWDY